MNEKRPTITDIARLASVSVGTASNVLNSKGRFSKATHDRVMAAAESLHYSPNALIRSLQRGKSGAVGILAWHIIGDAMFDIRMPLLKGITDGFAEYGFDTLVYARNTNEHRLAPAYFLDGRVDGVLLTPGGLNFEGMEALVSRDMPVVALYAGEVPEGVGSVNIDNVQGIRLAINHLASLGHRSVAYAGPRFTFDFCQRFDGYHKVMDEHPDMISSCVDLDRSYKLQARPVIDHILADPRKPTAVLVADDCLAFHMIQECSWRGISVPGRLSIVGFDDVMASVLPPGLTTIRQPAQAVGNRAASMLSQYLKDDSKAMESVRFPVDLVVRGTTSRPDFVA